MTSRKPLGQIIEKVPSIINGKEADYLEDTIFLEKAVSPENREESVRLYWFARTIKNIFEEILLACSAPVGRGFWLTAEYGVGKSHFLATLACLLSDNSEKLWSSIHDDEIREHRFKFQKKRLFPIVAGLRGKIARSQNSPITLLDQLEREIEEAINKLELQNKINITPVAEIINLFDGFSPAQQGVINNYILQKCGKRTQDLRKSQPEQFADLVKGYFKEQGLPLHIASSNIIERLQFFYKQIVNPQTGFNGLLFVIDEFETWLGQRPIEKPEGMFDSNVLQALTEILPKQHNYQIFTVIASQTDIPAQLRGRLKPLPILAGSDAARDYHVICAHRVRRFKEGMEADAKQYYHDFYNEFAYYKEDTEESFLETFPFHPLAYETVRRFTSSVQDMGGTRSSLNFLYDVLKSSDALQMEHTITLHDVYQYSPSFQAALSGPRFIETQRRYQDSVAVLHKIFSDDEEDRQIAHAILTILYLQYCISEAQTVPLSAIDIAEATLTVTGAVTGEERMNMLLGDMAGRIPQLDFDPSHPEKGARFNPRQDGPTPQMLLDERKALFTDTEIQERWESFLFASPAETRGQKALFAGAALDKAWTESVVVNQVTYDGETIVARSWRKELGRTLQDPEVHFRLVYLLQPSTRIPEQIEDPRIIVIEGAPLSERVKGAVLTYLAAKKMMNDFSPQVQKGPEAGQNRIFAETEFQDRMSEILQFQLEPFQKGNVHTKEGLNLDLVAALKHPTPNQRHDALLRPTLENAYREFTKMFDVFKIQKNIVPADAKNLVVGLIQGDTSTSKAVVSTLDQKAVGLGLSIPAEPRKLNAQHCVFFKLLDERLTASPAITLWPLLKEMSGCPYGIPPYLFTALILTYIRWRFIPTQAEIQLQPQHNLADQGGQKISINRLTRSNVVGLRWQTGIERFFDSLVTVAGPDLNAVHPYAKLIYPDLKLATAPQEIDTQVRLFLDHLTHQSPLIKSAADALKSLAETTNDALMESDTTILQQMNELYKAEDIEAFDARRKSIAQDVSTFKTAFERMSLLLKLAEKAMQTAQMYNQLHHADTGNEEKLAAEKSILLVRYKLSSLIGSETATIALLNDTEKFLEKLRNTQEIHAKRMLESLTKLKESLQGTTNAYLTGLGKLNQLTTLGPAQGHDLADRYDSLKDQIERELSGASQLHRNLSYAPPEQDVKELQQRTRQAFESRTKLLRSQLEKVIQEKGGGNDLKTLLELLQINKLNEVATTLTSAIIATLQKIMEDARTQVVRSRAFDRLVEQYPAVSLEDMDVFLNQLRKIMEEEFHKGPKDKRILLSFK